MAEPILLPYNIFLRDWRDYCIKKINERIEVVKGCWVWKGYISPDNKTRIRLKNVLTLSVQRISYLSYISDIPYGYHVTPKCKNPHCVNPHHLILTPVGMKIRDIEKLYSEVYTEDMYLVNLSPFYI